MASSLSDDEFNRMQMQLLELREKNYRLEDACRRQEKDVQTFQEQVCVLTKELDKTNKVLNKSKKAKEVEALMQESELLQRKLQSQEDEFRLQNETLMKELGQLVTDNEALTADNELLKGEGAKPGGAAPPSLLAPLQDEARRLQAQNSVLQEALAGCQTKHATELGALKQTISELEGQCVRLMGRRGTPVGGAGNQEGEVVSEEESSSKSSLENHIQVDGERDADGEAANGSQAVGQSVVDGLNEFIDHDKVISELKMSMNMEREEKKLLRDELQAVEARLKHDVTGFQEQVDKLTEKLKKKQESFLRLQEDKEKMFKELSEKLAESQAVKEAELAGLQQQTHRLKQELSEAKKTSDAQLERYQTRVGELEGQVDSLQRRVDLVGSEGSLQLAQHSERAAQQTRELERRLEERGVEVEQLRARLQESEQAHSNTTEQMLAVVAEQELQFQVAQEATRLAEKRKCLLDELAIKYQQEVDAHRDQRAILIDKTAALTAELTALTERMQSRSAEAERLQGQLTQTKAQLSNLDTAKSYLDRRLTETETAHAESRAEHEAALEACRAEHTTNMDRLTEQHQLQTQVVEKERDELAAEKAALLADIARLQQEIKDGVGDKKLHEKKGATVLKDLKRQFQAEKKRADKLQEKLQECLQSDSRSRQSVEELFRPIDPMERTKSNEGSSVCSWSPSAISLNVLAQTPEEDPEYVAQRQENEELLKRITDVQQQKWTLEERVSHLESSNAAMAEDLLEKTAVIEHYVMECKTDHGVTSPSQERMSLKRVVDFVKDKGDENQRDLNRRLQRMLEETLTKNMHLQQDLETMSKELVRLSKQLPSPASSGGAASPTVIKSSSIVASDANDLMSAGDLGVTN